MATLKSIKNKYLTNSDGTVLGVTTNTENVSLLSFKLATADSLSKFNLVDGFADDYNDATGVDASGSTDEIRNTTDNYYSGVSAIAPTGGTIATYSGYTSHTFPTGNTNFVVGQLGNVDVFVLGGGGYGGWNGGGGGGAGGFRTSTSHAVTAQTYVVTVGSGSTFDTPAEVGSPSSFDTITATLGGNGAPNGTGGTGGSGGGGSFAPTASPGGAGNSPATTPSQGNPGGSGSTASSGKQGGGGGGAGASGSNASGGGGGPAGNGATNDYQTGSPITYAGGGGGGAHKPNGRPGGSGGSGGGGAGHASSTPTPSPAGGSGTDGLGAGGGGGGGLENVGPGPGGDGGDGVVIIRYTDTAFEAYNPMTLQSNTFTAQTQPTTARIILDEETAVGTTIVDTDIKAYASRDNGTTFTQITLADQGQINYLAGIDPYTKLMLHCDGANSGTVFTDSSGSAHTVTAQGSTHTDTAIKKFGTASGQFGGDGTGDDLTIPDSTDWDIGTGDFTFDCWVYPTDDGSSYRKIFASGGWGTAGSEYDWIFDKTNSETLRLQVRAGSTEPSVVSTGTILNDVWTHLAAVRSGTTVTLYINGIADGTMTFAGNVVSHGALQVGRQVLVSSTLQMWQGYIDELRVSSGIARWTANFTPPATAYTHSRRLLSGSVDISGQPAGTNMKYKLTTHNQAITKQTRVYGTSMAWA